MVGTLTLSLFPDGIFSSCQQEANPNEDLPYFEYSGVSVVQKKHCICIFEHSPTNTIKLFGSSSIYLMTKLKMKKKLMTLKDTIFGENKLHKCRAL